MKHIFVTGRPGVGKTTLIKRVLECLSVKPVGFYTEEIRENGERVGFMLRTFDGKEAVMAHVRFQTPHRVGRYCVNIDALERVGVPALEQAVGGAELAVVDELGRMELYSISFQQAVIRLLDSGSTVLGVIQDRSNPFLDGIRARKDVHLVRVTEENRSQLAEDIAGMLMDISANRESRVLNAKSQISNSK